MSEDAEKICDLWERLDGILWNKARAAIGNWIEKIGFDEVEEAAVIACGKPMDPVKRFRYFCGICRSKLRAIEEQPAIIGATDRPPVHQRN